MYDQASSHVYRNDVIQFQFTMQFSMNCFGVSFLHQLRQDDGYGFGHISPNWRWSP